MIDTKPTKATSKLLWTVIDRPTGWYCWSQQGINRIMQDCSNSIANALELLQPCANPSLIAWVYFSFLPCSCLWSVYTFISTYRLMGHTIVKYDSSTWPCSRIHHDTKGIILLFCYPKLNFTFCLLSYVWVTPSRHQLAATNVNPLHFSHVIPPVLMCRHWVSLLRRYKIPCVLFSKRQSSLGRRCWGLYYYCDLSLLQAS